MKARIAHEHILTKYAHETAHGNLDLYEHFHERS